MNNPELDSILKKARLPELSEDSRDNFPGQVTSRLHRKVEAPRATHSFFPRLAWAFGFAASAILVALVLGKWHTSTKVADTSDSDILASAKFAGETLSMFPHQIRTIVEDAQGVHLVLSDRNDVPASPPLYIRICDGENCSSFITFSGQQINVSGQSVTVLSDPRGGIILTGDQFVWSTTGPIHNDDHLKIQARTLTQAAL